MRLGTPASLTVSSVSFTRTTLTWNRSTDNSGSLHYEVTVDLPSGPYSTNPSSEPTAGSAACRPATPTR
jgi:hypothetical protein